ncbi:MAG: HEAT repeat domain-containing protein [Planctomycetota bacterium]|jgi:hypothetical protein
MRTKIAFSSVFLALVAGCMSDRSEEIGKLMERTQDLNSRLLDAEAGLNEQTIRLERLQSLYHDLSVRHKDLQFEVRLLRSRAEPFSSVEEEKKTQERMLQIVKQLGTAEDAEWPKLKEELVAMGHIAVPFLLESYKTQGARAMRRSSQVLLAIRDPRSLAPLLVGLDHPRTRHVSAEALGRLGVKKAARDLARYLRDERADIRLIVSEALGNLGDLSGMPVLIEWLDHTDDSNRILAVTILRRVTEQNFDYDPYGAPEDRKNAIDMWKKWWRNNKSRFELALDLESEPPLPGVGEKKGGGKKEEEKGGEEKGKGPK